MLPSLRKSRSPHLRESSPPRSQRRRRDSSQPRPNLAALGQIWPSRARFDQSLAKLDQNWSVSDASRAESAKTRPSPSTVGRHRPNVGQFRPKPTNPWPSSANIGRNRPTWLSLGRIRPKLDPLRTSFRLAKCGPTRRKFAPSWRSLPTLGRISVPGATCGAQVSHLSHTVAAAMYDEDIVLGDEAHGRPSAALGQPSRRLTTALRILSYSLLTSRHAPCVFACPALGGRVSERGCVGPPVAPAEVPKDTPGGAHGALCSLISKYLVSALAPLPRFLSVVT